MTNKKKAIIGVILCIILAVFISCLGSVKTAEAEVENIQYTSYSCSPEELVEKYPIKWPEQKFRDEGYDNFADWWEALKEKRNSFEGMTDALVEELGDYLSEEDITNLQEYEHEITTSISLAEIEEYEAKIQEIVDAANAKYNAAQQTAQQTNYSSSSSNSYVSNGSGLTKSGGVNYYNGRKETWYSSNTLYHYKTSEWTLGSDGVYRTSDGYVVVAASDLPQGSLVETSLGTGKVLDSGCAPGTSDIYTAW